jgi:cobalt-zinc-cadmium efflux system outer membrane protein
MRVHRVFAALTVIAATMASSAVGRCAERPLMLSRQRAVELGAERAPAVREATAPLHATSALRDASSSLFPYAPRVTVSGGRRTGNFGSGVDLSASVVQDLSLRGLGRRREEVASAVERVARSEVERARLEGGALAALAWVGLLEAQELVRVREAARRDADEIARVARARTDRGVALPAEAALAAAEVGAAELGERDAEGQLFEASAALQFAVGLPPGTIVVAAGVLANGDLPDAPAPTPATQTHPAQTAARTRIDLARADAALARAQATPTLGLGANYTREGTGEQTLTGIVSLPLPILDPSRFDAARHETSVASAEGQAERIRSEIARDASISEHERSHTREVYETLATKVLLPLREAVRLARASYQAGTENVTALLLLRQRLVVSEERLGRASADVLRADVRYELTHATLLARMQQ